MSQARLTTDIITVTPEMAAGFLQKMIHNRPVSEKSVKEYANDMLTGNWGLTGQGIIFDDRGRLLDGQHRMRAVIAAKIPVKFMAVRGISPDMFSRLDVGNKRTSADVISCKHNVTVAGALKYVYREECGFSWWNNNVRLKPYMSVECFGRHSGIVESACAIQKCKSGGMMTPSTLAYCHYRAAMDGRPDVLEQFFSRFASGADLSKDSPILALRNYLAYAGDRATVKDFNMIAAFIIAWYKIIDGSRCLILRLPIEMPTWRTEIKDVNS